jgi:hypothetical protein
MTKIIVAISTTLLFVAATAFAQAGNDIAPGANQATAPKATLPSDVSSLAARYTSSCIRGGQLHKCGEGLLAAVFEGKVVCRPSFEKFPFAKTGETPCNSDPYSGIVVK